VIPDRTAHKVGIETLATHRDRLDVRSPAEFALDHLPGALSTPVLDDRERAEIGTLHAQASAFEAKKAGAALVARNIARILETVARDQPRDWAPLVYCWRGGQRSRSLTHVLNEIGFHAVQLDGGYRSYRRHVVERLAVLPLQRKYVVICGLTGSGKSRLLAALAALGAPTLDLEGLARHRGSLLGDFPGDPQPSQKRFESLVLDGLEHLDPAQPVFVESESKKIGTVQVPEALLAAMRESPCVRVATPAALRVELLKGEYAHFLADPAVLAQRLAHLVPLLGHATIARWNDAAAAGDFDTLVAELLERHYDPMYSRSIERNFPRHTEAIEVVPDAVDDEAFRALARDLLAKTAPRHDAALAPNL
jgi:tRNA 2-selenouridine synthase